MIFQKQIYSNKRRLLCCLLFFAIACNQHRPAESARTSVADSLALENEAEVAFDLIDQLKKDVCSGDLVLRTGRDFTSEAMRQLSLNDKTYSHCGIASFENDSLFVYHSIGGEWNPDEKLRRDPFEFFCNPYENRGVGIFRYNFNEKEKARFLEIVKDEYDKEVSFDMQFDLNSDDKMYCSELVYKALEKATGKRIHLPLTTINSIEFVAVDNLFDNPFCKPVKTVVFTYR